MSHLDAIELGGGVALAVVGVTALVAAFAVIKFLLAFVDGVR